MMQSKQYWEKRFEQLTAAQLDKGEEYFRNLERQYQQAIAEVEKDLARWYTRYASENGITLTEAKRLLKGRELEEFRMDVQEYIAKGRTLKYSSQWAKQLEAASTKFHVSRLEALKLQMQQKAEAVHAMQAEGLDKLTRDIYADGYYKTVFEVQKGFGIGFDMMRLDHNRIDKLIAKPWAADGKNFSQRIWGNRTQLVGELENRLTQSIIRGQSPKKVIAETAERFHVSKSRAGALVMTESAFFASASQKDAYTSLGVEQYKVLATLDSHTSEMCRAMDGKVMPMSEHKAGVTAPPFHVRCRSTTVPYFDDEFSIDDQRAARDADGKYYTVPADMTYEEWKKTFVDGGSKEGLAKNIKTPDSTEDVATPLKMPVNTEDVAAGVELPTDLVADTKIADDIKNGILNSIKAMQEEYDIKLDRISYEDISGQGKIPLQFYPIRAGRNFKYKLIVNSGYDWNETLELFNERIYNKNYKNGLLAAKNLTDLIKHEMAHVLTFQ
ncbi:MAG: minor capsid protein, partial [Selenomonadales bacterium]|nr:minor capsid protein [Selenomonadales bacterium]